jgi:hypothetical protein
VRVSRIVMSQVAVLVGTNIFVMEKELVNFIRQKTRVFQFNFEEVANAVNNCEQFHETNIILPLSATQCREIFAHDYHFITSTVTTTKEIETETKEAPTETGAPASAPAYDDEPQSLSEVLQRHELMRKENDKKMDQIFKRVLGALETTEKVTLNENDEVVIAHRQRIEMQENERQQKILIEEQQRELEIFEAQRAKLKKRFDVDSEDAQGIDPLSQRIEGTCIASAFTCSQPFLSPPFHCSLLSD